MNTHSDCSDASLRILLRVDEDSDEYRSVAHHVHECPRCQARLGTLAADEHLWHEAHEMLVTATDAEPDEEDHGSQHPWFRQRWQQRPTAWTESMARQVLSPPSHPEMLGRIGR